MANKWSITLLPLLIVSLASFASSQVPISVISAAPAVLPFESPQSSPPAPGPTLSPDITPLFPSPAGPSPAESSLPIIPSSPSPPNPDEVLAPGPIMAFSPSGLLADSSAFSLNAFGSLCSVMLLLGGLLALFG